MFRITAVHTFSLVTENASTWLNDERIWSRTIRSRQVIRHRGYVFHVERSSIWQYSISLFYCQKIIYKNTTNSQNIFINVKYLVRKIKNIKLCNYAITMETPFFTHKHGILTCSIPISIKFFVQYNIVFHDRLLL